MYIDIDTKSTSCFFLNFLISEYSKLNREDIYKSYKGPERSHGTLTTVPVISVTNCMEQCMMNKKNVTVSGSQEPEVNNVLLANLFPCKTGDVMATDVYEKIVIS